MNTCRKILIVGLYLLDTALHGTLVFGWRWVFKRVISNDSLHDDGWRIQMRRYKLLLNFSDCWVNHLIIQESFLSLLANQEMEDRDDKTCGASLVIWKIQQEFITPHLKAPSCIDFEFEKSLRIISVRFLWYWKGKVSLDQKTLILLLMRMVEFSMSQTVLPGVRVDTFFCQRYGTTLGVQPWEIAREL